MKRSLAAQFFVTPCFGVVAFFGLVFSPLTGLTETSDDIAVDVQNFSIAERELLEAACGAVRFSGTAADYESCLETQIEALTSAGGLPEIENLDPTFRGLIENACGALQFAGGVGEYIDCFKQELAGLEAIGGLPDLATFASEERELIETGCLSERAIGGPVGYARCLETQIVALREAGGLPDLNALTNLVRGEVRQACESERYVGGAGSYASCLNTSIAALPADAFRPTGEVAPAPPAASAPPANDLAAATTTPPETETVPIFEPSPEEQSVPQQSRNEALADNRTVNGTDIAPRDGGANSAALQDDLRPDISDSAPEQEIASFDATPAPETNDETILQNELDVIVTLEQPSAPLFEAEPDVSETIDAAPVDVAQPPLGSAPPQSPASNDLAALSVDAIGPEENDTLSVAAPTEPQNGTQGDEARTLEEELVIEDSSIEQLSIADPSINEPEITTPAIDPLENAALELDPPVLEEPITREQDEQPVDEAPINDNATEATTADTLIRDQSTSTSDLISDAARATPPAETLEAPQPQIAALERLAVLSTPRPTQRPDAVSVRQSALDRISPQRAPAPKARPAVRARPAAFSPATVVEGAIVQEDDGVEFLELAPLEPIPGEATDGGDGAQRINDSSIGSNGRDIVSAPKPSRVVDARAIETVDPGAAQPPDLAEPGEEIELGDIETASINPDTDVSTDLDASVRAPNRSSDGWLLLGVVFTSDRGARALLADAQGGARRVRQGDTLGRWNVSAIGADFVRLTSEDATEFLRLHK